jgi:hypothetical protein
MKKLVLSFSLVLSLIGSRAQTFTDNFDTYTAGAWLCQSNSTWKTWANTPGGADDVKITAAKSRSGANSLRFNSVAGGPADVILPFGGQYNTGTFQFTCYLNVATGKKGYINFQEQTVVGKAWTIDINFDSIGGFDIMNTQSGLLLKGNYAQNQWIKVAVVVNLSTNSWEFFINDASKGNFQNSYRQVASANFYAIAGSDFYVDDVSYTYTPFTLPSLNGAVTFIDNVSGKLATQKVNPSVEIRNLGTTTLSAAEVEITYDGQTIGKTVSGLNVASLGYAQIKFDELLTMSVGNKTVTATLKTINGNADPVAGDNVKQVSVNPVIPAPGKMVVAEEGTGTWCTWCPRGAVWMNNMDTRYPGFFLGIAVHNNDPMENANYDGGLGTKISGFPSAIVDRGTDIDPSAMEADFFERIVIAPKATIKNGASYNASTRELKVSLTTKFSSNVSGNWRLAFVLIEDSVTGTGTGWSQVNAYAGGSRGPMGGFENLPNPVPASMMVYDHVGRIIYPNFNGLANAFATTVNTGDSFTHNFTVMLDPSWEANELQIAGLLIDPSGRIDNGSLAKLDAAIANGFVNGQVVASIGERTSAKPGVQLYPNPATNLINITVEEASAIEVYNIEGKLIMQTNIEKQEIISCENWPIGIYFVKVSNAKGIETLKLVHN